MPPDWLWNAPRRDPTGAKRSLNPKREQRCRFAKTIPDSIPGCNRFWSVTGKDVHPGSPAGTGLTPTVSVRGGAKQGERYTELVPAVCPAGFVAGQRAWVLYCARPASDGLLFAWA